LKNGLEYITD